MPFGLFTTSKLTAAEIMSPGFLDADNEEVSEGSSSKDRSRYQLTFVMYYENSLNGYRGQRYFGTDKNNALKFFWPIK